MRGRRVLCKACANECLVALKTVKHGWRGGRKETVNKDLKVFGEKAELVCKLARTKNIFTWKTRSQGDFVLKEDVAALHDVSWEAFMEGRGARQAAWSDLSCPCSVLPRPCSLAVACNASPCCALR